MSKLYLLLLTTQIASCMEMQLYKKHHRESDPEIPLTTFNQTTPNPMPIYVCQANQPGWQQLNQIMNMDYHPKQSACINTAELTPVYRPAGTKTNEAQQKPLPLTCNSTQPNTDLIKKLHQNAAQYFNDINNRDDKKLICLINEMNYAKNNGIHEDMMVQFALENLPYITISLNPYFIPLFFSCLKKYFTAIKTSQESLPVDSAIFAHYTPLNLILNPDTTIAHPALVQLKKDIHHIMSQTCSTFTLLKFLYADSKEIPQILSSDPYPNSYDDLKDDFYKNISQSFINKWNIIPRRYIQLINKAKELHFIKEETDFGYAMLTYEPSTFMKFKNFMGTNLDSYSSVDVKNHISIFCWLIGKYNQARENKITPLNQQNNNYQRHKKMDFIPLPDSFDNNLFDENHYAFKEYEQLIADTIVLQQASDEEIQQQTNKLYPSRK